LDVGRWALGVFPALPIIHFVALVASAKTEGITDSSNVKY